MKKLLFILAATFMFSCSESADLGDLNVAGTSVVSDEATALDESIATDVIVDDLLAESLVFMREEEKLARDVYLKLYEIWQEDIFQNIASREQKHTDAIQQLIVQFGLTDPVSEDVVGSFQNQDLQDLYDNMTAQGANSLVDALEIGALIEEVDIKDLNDAMALITNEDVLLVYNNLLKGSRNHLRGFTTNLEMLNEPYYPQILEDAYYNEIINSDMEKGGFANGNGDGSGSQRGRGTGHQQGVGMGNGNGQGTGPHGDGTGTRDGSCNS